MGATSFLLTEEKKVNPTQPLKVQQPPKEKRQNKKRDHVQTLPTQQETPPLDKDGPKGIPNIGNTCYLNAVVQVVCMSPLMTAYTNQRQHTIKELDCMLQLYQAGSLTEVQEAVSLFRELCPQYRGMEQHDAGELLRDLLSATCSQCGTSCSFLKKWCHVEGKNCMSCPKCGQSRQGGVIEYAVVPVQCREKSMQEAWERFVGTSDLYFSGLCDQCGHFQSRTLTSPEILNAPEMLWVAISRWQEEEVAHMSWREEDLTKNTNPLEVEHILSVMLSDGVLQEYILTSLVLHHGNKMGSGHYTCQVRGTDGWVTIDDERVTEADVCLSDPSIYLVGYIKGETCILEKGNTACPSPVDTSWRQHIPAVFDHLHRVNAGDVKSQRLEDLVAKKPALDIKGLGDFPTQIIEDLDREIRKVYIIQEEKKLGTLFGFHPERMDLPPQMISRLEEWSVSHTKYHIEVLLPEALECLIQLMEYGEDK